MHAFCRGGVRPSTLGFFRKKDIMFSAKTMSISVIVSERFQKENKALSDNVSVFIHQSCQSKSPQTPSRTKGESCFTQPRTRIPVPKQWDFCLSEGGTRRRGGWPCPSAGWTAIQPNRSRLSSPGFIVRQWK